LQGTSSYINYFLNRDSRPDHPQPLISIDNVAPDGSHEAEDSLVKK
jgi:hypothetical protein